MTVLRKNRFVDVIPGSPGQKYIPSSPARPGHWTTTKVVKVGCRPSDKTKWIERGWRLASYEEIKNFLVPFHERSNKCRIAIRQMTTVYRTQNLFTSIAPMDYNKFLAVGTLPGYENGICIVLCNRFATDYEIRPNPVYNANWNFSDYYTCAIVNGNEVITAK